MTEESVKVDLGELVNWTDEQCVEFDTKHSFRSSLIRDLLKEAKGLLDNLNKSNEELKTLRDILWHGKMLGYVITCPDCHVSYNVTPQELNYDKEITCLDCGAKYVQNKNIFGVYLREKEGDQK